MNPIRSPKTSGFLLACLSISMCLTTCKAQGSKETGAQTLKISLPSPKLDSKISIEAALQHRRSVRKYKDRPLSLQEVGQVLWAAQGISSRSGGLRTAPSAGATYPLEIRLAVRLVEGLTPGLYHYYPAKHELRQVSTKQLGGPLALASLGQMFIKQAPAVVVISAVPQRTSRRYGERALRYVYMESGHAAENIHLQAESLNLATVIVGAFEDAKLVQLLKLPEGEIPLLLMPIGKP